MLMKGLIWVIGLRFRGEEGSTAFCKRVEQPGALVKVPLVWLLIHQSDMPDLGLDVALICCVDCADLVCFIPLYRKWNDREWLPPRPARGLFFCSAINCVWARALAPSTQLKRVNIKIKLRCYSSARREIMGFTPMDRAMVTKALGITSTVNLLRVRLKVKSSPFYQQTFHGSYECQVTTEPLKFHCLLAACVKFRRFLHSSHTWTCLNSLFYNSVSNWEDQGPQVKPKYWKVWFWKRAWYQEVWWQWS